MPNPSGMVWGQRQEAVHREVGRLEVPSPPTLGGKKQDLEIEEVLFHPKYNINGKKAEGIPEFYDYDVALIKLKTKLKYSETLRSDTCLPKKKWQRWGWRTGAGAVFHPSLPLSP